MTKFLIALYDPPGIAESDLAAAAVESMAVVREARDVGVWVFGGGLMDAREASVVAIDGTLSNGPFADGTNLIAGFSVLDVPSREVALEWAAKLAVACRSPQEVREFQPEPA